MSSLSELQRIDRELSSELIESPINPAFLHVFSLEEQIRPLLLFTNKRRGTLVMAETKRRSEQSL